jgi:hypothetical protein
MSVDNPTMSAIFCGRDGAQYPPTTGGSNAECDLAKLSISAWKLSPVADVYFTARGAAQIMVFCRQDCGDRLLDGVSHCPHFSIRFQVDLGCGERQNSRRLTVARNPTLEKSATTSFAPQLII